MVQLVQVAKNRHNTLIGKYEKKWGKGGECKKSVTGAWFLDVFRIAGKCTRVSLVPEISSPVCELSANKHSSESTNCKEKKTVRDRERKEREIREEIAI